LLLPPVLVDPAASVVAELVRAAPDIHPGFYSFPTPAKREKIELLEGVMRAVDRTIGSTLFDQRVAELLDSEDVELEQELLSSAHEPTDRIGVGLGLGYLGRTRRHKAPDALARGA
jgi:hypothetical protein